MLSEEKTTILTRIHATERITSAIINMMETGNSCESMLIQVQNIQLGLRTTGHLLLLYQLHQSIENICHNNCPEERSAEIERLVELYKCFLIYS